MSKARICDRCKKVLDCNPSAKIEVDFGYYGTQHYELCEDCKKILVCWLTERKTMELKLSDEMGVDIDVKLKTIFELEDKLKAETADVMYFKDQIRADTVRKMQERFDVHILEEYKTINGTYLIRLDTSRDQIAKEMIGEENAD